MASKPPLRPRHWPLTAKLTVAVFLVALVPLLVVALINARDVDAQSVQRETEALERRAEQAGRRLEERVGRLRAFAELTGTMPAIVEAMRDPVTTSSRPTTEEAQLWDSRHPQIHLLLESIHSANPRFVHVYLLSEHGTIISSSESDDVPDMIGRVYDFRPYFRAPIADRRPFVSDVLKNANSPGNGIFLSAPVVVDGRVAAVAVIKVDSDALHEVVADLAKSSGRALLVDRFGVVVSDAKAGETRKTDHEESLQFHPLGAVDRYFSHFEETKRYGDPQKENYLDRIRRPLGLDRLWAGLRQAQVGARELDFPVRPLGDRVDTTVGFAPVIAGDGEPYGYVVLAEPSEAFRDPLQLIGRQALLRFFAVVAMVAIAMALLIHRLTGRISRLAEATERVADGDLATGLVDDRDDELGRLAATFNRMTRRLARAQADGPDPEVLQHAVGRVQEASQQLGAAVAQQGDDAAVHTATQQVADAADALAVVSPQDVSVRSERVDLGKLIASVAMATRAEAQLAETTLEVDEPDAPLHAEVDGRRLRVAVLGLLRAACQMTRRGTVTVSAAADEGAWSIEVGDTGIGLTRRQVQRVLGGDAEEGEGAADEGPVQELVLAWLGAAALGARLTVDSAPGEGTTARIVGGSGGDVA